MMNRLKKAQELLTKFNHQLIERRRIYDGFHLAGDHQDEQRNNFLAKELAYSWLYAALDHYFIEPVNTPQEMPKAFLRGAASFYEEWLSKELDIQTFEQYIIPQPREEESLNDYLQRLREEIIHNYEHRTIWWKSLRRFTEFLRNNIPFDQQGWLKILFPDEMGLVLEKTDEGTIAPTAIVRKIPLTAYSIDIYTAAAILEALADEALNGRLDAQLTAVEALALCWVCLTSARLRFPTELNMLYESNALVQSYEQAQPIDSTPHSKYYLELQTYLGDIPVEISRLQYEYLDAIYTAETRSSFFQSSLRSLRRSFDRAIAKAGISASMGKITFLSFTTLPHLAIGKRCQKTPATSR